MCVPLHHRIWRSGAVSVSRVLRGASSSSVSMDAARALASHASRVSALARVHGRDRASSSAASSSSSSASSSAASVLRQCAKHRRATVMAASPYKAQDEISGRVVLVTGANRGIGLELCKLFLEKGNEVRAGCRVESDELAALARASNGRLTVSHVDVGDERSIAEFAAGLKAAGVEHVDVVLNNAGVVGSDGYSKWDLQSTTQEEMIYVFKVNTCGPVLMVKYLNQLGLIGSGAADGSETLVGNVTSKVGSIDDNGSGQGYAYRASKSALNNCNRSMQIDLAPQGVHFALLHPGWVRTGMTEGRGLIDARESASGLIRVLEGAFGDCEHHWFDYKGDAIPW